ncbi:MAG: hypothetical protein Greene041619_404 [Candidatus Peregrinibacteria bacterium Greene0416_19]|nr:MAG: hypothetical protein Greene041619_404 [Candidatus Peregrinibacteria bacterium Greene0416_19]
MSIDACIAHAIHSDLDIIEALPEVEAVPVEELEAYVERFVLNVQESMYNVITDRGEKYIRSHDAAGLCATCLEAGVGLPPHMLLKMCQTILQLTELDARFILDTDGGKSLYYVKIGLTA